MASVVIAGNTSGTVTLQAPDISGSTVLTLPTTSGTLVTTAGGSTVPFALGSAASPSITFTGDTNTGIFSPGADSIGFAEGGAEIARFDSSGNFGLGTITPNIFGRGYPTMLTANSASGAAAVQINSATGNSAWLDMGVNGTRIGTLAASSSIFEIGTGGAVPVAFYTNANYRLYITTAGNVGIGTTSPQRILTVGAGTGASVMSIFASTSLSSAIHFTDTNTTTDFQGFVTYGHDVDALRFGTAETERMRIDSSGNLLVGTTSALASGRYSCSFNGQVSNGIVLQTTFSSTGTDFIRFLNSAGNTCGEIEQNGTTTVQYLTSSDYRLKENIAPMTGALATVQSLKPVTYKWKADGSEGQGFIAHELAEVVPDCVSGQKDGVETYIDENGVEQTRPKYQGIDTSFLVATLTAAIQEQQAIINEQASTIAAFEARLTALEGTK